MEILFVIVDWPYLTGKYAYAPKSLLYQGTFSSSNIISEPMLPRDDEGQPDFIMQERQFLRFYRESIKHGELPFWNEYTFGGLSQEDSMIYSYLSPFHIPWLFISNDYIAKGVQIFMVLNFGMFGFLLWCRILELSPPWTLLVVIFGTLTPLSLHFLAHTHQPGIYFCGLYVTAAYNQFLKYRKSIYLMSFFVFIIVAITINFLSIFLFITLFIAIISIVHFVHSAIPKKEIINRIFIVIICYILANVSMSFFLGPIVLESYLVREPVSIAYQSYAPWASLGKFLGALVVYNPFNSPYIPFMVTIPLLILRIFRKPISTIASLEVWSLLYIWCFTILVTSFVDLQHVFRSLMPGMKYSNNALFRMLFLGNLFGILLIASLSQYFADNAKRQSLKQIIIILVSIVLLNGFLWLISINLDLWVTILNALRLPKAHELINVFSKAGAYKIGIGFCVSMLFLYYWYQLVKKRKKSTSWMPHIQLTTVFFIGIGYTLIYQFNFPNMPVAFDPINHPIFSEIKKDTKARALTLENCSSERHSWYRYEATLAGLSTFDGPVDCGLFNKTRKFWYPLNNISECIKQGIDLFEVNWICSEKVISVNEGELKPGSKRLFKALGIKYLLTDCDINDTEVVKLKQVGNLKLYSLKGGWSDVTFLPDVNLETLQNTIKGLLSGDYESVNFFDCLESRKHELEAKRISNMKWDVLVPEDLKGKSGVLFMNHPVEYCRGLRFPFTKLPLEGKWIILSDNGIPANFPLTDVPFRIADIILGERITIKYDLTHYQGWFLISSIGLSIFIILFLREKNNSLNKETMLVLFSNKKSYS